MDRNRPQRARHRGTEWRPMVSDAGSSRPPSSRPMIDWGASKLGRDELSASRPRATLAAAAFFRLLPRPQPGQAIWHNFGAYIRCEMAVYGYARVSTSGQTLATQ